ncbi:MAG: DUF4136 domain-containing protein [Gammaproteobacteria bacterium]|nr:DUF4136 domain-containing protein [Gammaproteobacteria bacterium]
MFRIVFLAAAALTLVACATPQPQVRVHTDGTAVLGDYRHYAYVESLGTDKAEYTTLLTRYLTEAVDRELGARGYQRVDAPADADFLVNFYVSTRERTDVRERPAVSVDAYYGYRRGGYGVWTGYPVTRDVRSYTEGTLHIDLVDRALNQLVWEGVAVGRVTRAAMDDPRSAVADGVAAIFQRYPYQAATGPADSGR